MWCNIMRNFDSIFVVFILWCMLFNIARATAQKQVQQVIEEADDEFFDEEEEHLHSTKTVGVGTKIELPPKESKPLQSEDEFLYDADEFEGFEQPKKEHKRPSQPSKEQETVTLVEQFTEPQGPKTWYLEIVYLSFMLLYGINYYIGKASNEKLANAWAVTFQDLFSSNFSMFGDKSEFLVTKDSASAFSVACAGRVHCYGAQVTIDLKKRHDLISWVTNLFSPRFDTVTIEVAMEHDVMQPFVFTLLKKREEKQFVKNHQDVAKYASPVAAPRLSALYAVYAENDELVPAILTEEVVKTLNTYEQFVNSMYFSDQSSASRVFKKVLRFEYKLPSAQDMAKLSTLMKMTFYMIDHVAGFRLSKPALAKNEKVRSKLVEDVARQTHEQRQELAQKKKLEKKLKTDEMVEKMSPEAQKRWEEKEYRKQLTKKQPKFKVVYG
jgi:hypothetical protein